MNGECLTEVRGTSDLLLFSSFSSLGKLALCLLVTVVQGEFVVVRSYAPSLCTGGMAAPSAGSLEFLTRRHGVKVDTTASVEQCALAVGAIAGIENVLSASRMNNAVVLFVRTVELANLLTESGIEIDGIFVLVLPLSTPSRKVTLSNVPPFIKNETLAGMLARYGKLISPLKMIPIGVKSPQLKHVMSFRRFTYMVLKDNVDELDLTLNFRHEDVNYVIYATTNVMKCYGCGERGHLVRACPKKGNDGNALIVVTENGQNDVAAVAAEMPGPSTALVVPENPMNSSEETGKDEIAPSENDEVRISPGIEQIAEELTLGESENSRPSAEKEGMVMEEENSEVEVPVLSDDGCCFKTPQKRKLVECHRQGKRKDGVGLSQTDTDSESDISECSFSASLPLGSFPSRIYSIDDIKSFLMTTKNLRKVKIEDYFPDIMQFIEKIKTFRSENCFTDQEVYRLKKILTKLKSEDFKENS